MIAEAELNSAGVRLRLETSIYAMECSENTANGPPFIETPQILGDIPRKTALIRYFRPNVARGFSYVLAHGDRSLYT